MAAADVEWILSQVPLSDLNPAVFPKATPLPEIIQHECRLLRCQPGEVVAREGDYVASAFLVLSGNVQVFLSHLPGEAIGRRETKRMSWWESIQAMMHRNSWPESRSLAQVSTSTDDPAAIEKSSDRTAVFVQDLPGLIDANRAVQLSPGEMFGEVAAMYRSPLAVTAVAETETTLLEIRWQGLRLLHRDPNLGRQLDEHYRRHWLLVHLRETPLLRFLPEAALAAVANSVQLRSFGRMEWHADYRRAKQLPAIEQIEAEPIVALEGHASTDLILVRSGFARLCRRHGVGWQTLAYLGKGAIFGLREMSHNWHRSESSVPVVLQESLRAIGFVDTIQIPAEVAAEHIFPHVRIDELPSPIEPIDASRNGRSLGELLVAEEDRDLDVPTGLLEFIGQHRLNNGRQAMLIDLDRCTRCDDCVKACASTHDGNPRFVRTGPRWGGLQVAEACMHCADPVCMIGCPTGAIARDLVSGAISIHDPVCIGCGVCAAACPYENIRMAAIRDPQGNLLTDQATGQPITKATKCDLCSTLPSGPACQQACPHQALVRIDLGDPSEIANWLEKRK